MGYLIDTNILSELRKQQRADRRVWNFYAGLPPAEVYTSVLVLGEIRHGVERIRARDIPSAEVLEKWLNWVRAAFRGRILPVNEEIADTWGRLGHGQPIAAADALLAATALVHDLTLVTRNVNDVARTGVRLINPFKDG